MELSRTTLQGLTEVIRRVCGLALGPEKAYLVRHRLAPVVQREGLAGFEQLLDRLNGRSPGRLQEAIIEAITTKETSFFRDHACFAALESTVLPECGRVLQDMPRQRHRIRLWSAGCATGQEAYSLAMLVREAGSVTLRESACTILATDLSATALEYAQAGCYTASQVRRGVSEARLALHFNCADQNWAVTEPVRRLVSFRRFDLLRSLASLGAFDVILCRNVLIYFDEPTRQRVCSGLCDVLQDGGWLVLGAAESLATPHPRIEIVTLGRTRLYRKRQRGG
jgi:chemotaxis protein methyltransferase CheR